MKQQRSKSFLERIDLFGRNFVLSFEGQSEFTTVYGGIISLFTLIFVFYTIYTFGKEIVTKENPSLLNRRLNSKHRQNLTLNFGTGFQIESYQGIPIPDYSKYLTFSASLTNMTWINGNDFLYDNMKVKLSPCSKKKFHPETEEMYDFDLLDNGYCINETVKIGGFQDNPYNIFLTINLGRCKNETNSTTSKSVNSNVKCASNEEIDQFLSRNDTQMTFYYEEISFSPINYDNPVYYYITEDFFKINPYFTQINQYYLQEYIVSTDSGILVPNTIDISYQHIDKSRNYFYHSNNSYSDSFIKIQFFTSEYVTLNLRSYAKLPQIVAQLGGLLKVIFSVFEVGLIFIYKRKMNEKVITSLYNINENDLEDSVDSSKSPKGKDSKKKISLKNQTKEVNKSIIELKHDESTNKSKDIILNNNEDQSSKMNECLDSSLVKEEKDHASMLERKLVKYAKSQEKKSEEEDATFEISFLEHLIALVCPNISGELLKKKIDIYTFLTDYSVEYTDVISFVNTKSDLEKLKYVLMNPKQIALYNLISPPENPIKKSDFKNKVSFLYRYQRDLKSQIKQANIYLEDLKKGKRKSHLDYKLLELLD
jgi:hypothetical protein